uniref:Reticulocyte-binding protein 2 like a n=1 Tax=Talaromyces marneffei PM1 TaxID=1077442 RepID=A0A093VIJ0_TALMA
MLDENLPRTAFYLSNDKKKQSNHILFTQHGNESEPAYTLRRLDPAEPSSRNRYAVALFDPYIPDVLYGEVLITPEWTQPTLSAEAIRQNGGVPPPPEPILPSQFTVHLYNPDQEVIVRHKPKTWNSQPSWEFEMPQQSFKQPSNSTLDQVQSGPAASDLTPKLKFVWRKDGSLSKDFACYLSGKTTTPDDRKKSKEPDITISILKGLREITLYEPNLYRVEMEDFKGLEVVLMLGAVVIRDVFFAPLKDAFNVVGSPTSSRTNSATAEVPSIPSNSTKIPAAVANANGSIPPRQPTTTTIPLRNTRPPPPSQPNLDPRTKWEIDAENARIKQQEDLARRERRRKAEEEERRTKKLIEAEQKAQRKRQAEIDKETERLKKVYGKEDEKSRQQRPNQPNHSHHHSAGPAIRVSSYTSPTHQARYSHYMPAPPPQPPRPGPYMQSSAAHHSSISLRPAQPHPRPQSSMSYLGVAPTASSPAIPRLKERRSIFGFLKTSDGEPNRLSKKKSSVF